jgi:pSer/pThr/pTyr-binding forkhead associated (FHA) protein
MPAQLQAMNGGSSILLDKPILLLGRDPECDIQLESPKISRRHCCIAQVGESLVVRDLGSTNGIRINGVRVLEGYLKGGDELTIGNQRYQVRWDALLSAAGSPERKNAVVQAGVPVLDPTAGVQSDSVLESCEDPVPLAEPAGAPVDVLKSRSPSDMPIPPDPDSSVDSSFTPGPPSDDPGSAIVPNQNDGAAPHEPHPQITPP